MPTHTSHRKRKDFVNRPIAPEGAPLDNYRLFLEDGVINVNLNNAESHKMTESEIHLHVLHSVLVQQFSLKAGLNKFGKTGKDAVSEELQQLHDMETYIPVDPMTLTK